MGFRTKLVLSYIFLMHLSNQAASAPCAIRRRCTPQWCTRLYTYGNGGVDGVIRLAMPLEYLTSARNTLYGLVGGATAVTILIGLLFSYVLSNLTSKPLRDMADAAARIGQGGAKVRLFRSL